MRRHNSGSILTAVILAMGITSLTSSARSQVTFDFETLAVDTSGTLTSVSQTVGGITVTITRPPSTTMNIDNISAFGPASFGARTLSPFSEPLVDDFFVANFSSAVTSASIQFGDFGADDDDTISLEAFDGSNASGSSLGSTTGSWGLNDFFNGNPPNMMSVAAPGILSVRFKGGSAQGPQSLYWDNLTVTQREADVPEPGTFALLTCGAAVGLAVWRRRR